LGCAWAQKGLGSSRVNDAIRYPESVDWGWCRIDLRREDRVGWQQKGVRISLVSRRRCCAARRIAGAWRDGAAISPSPSPAREARGTESRSPAVAGRLEGPGPARGLLAPGQPARLAGEHAAPCPLTN
jgi:hypothetical protein